MKSAEWYDEAMTGAGARSLVPLEDSPYLPMYQAAAGLIPHGAKVCELGCGTGRFARLILPNVESYVGIDFAPAVIEEALRYTEQHVECKAAFIEGDLTRMSIPDSADVYVALEVLEHIDGDLDVLDRIPSGKYVIISVPSFDAEAHVRFFPTGASAIERYGLPMIRSFKVGTKGGVLWLLAGVV
jgi:SAM-dependent methyltransferase